MLGYTNPFKITFPEESFNCSEMSCSSIRFHSPLQSVRVRPENSSNIDVVPNETVTWKSTFDPSHDWDTFRVNASTTQVEYAIMNKSEEFSDHECETYGYPFLAIRLCLKQTMINGILIGLSQAEIDSLIAVWKCVETDKSNCFTNKTWMTLPVNTSRALMWRRFCWIDYQRTDGYIKTSSPVDNLSPTPIAFDIRGLFRIYNLSYGVADLSDSSTWTTAIKKEIRYQTIEQATSFLAEQEDAPIVRTSGDHFAGSATVRAFILPLIMDYIDTMTSDYLTNGSSMGKYYPLTIPLYWAYAFTTICCLMSAWAIVVILWCRRNNGDSKGQSSAGDEPSISDIYIFGSSVDGNEELVKWLRTGRTSRRPSITGRINIHWTKADGFRFIR
jgi:hypothetical protein